MNALSEGLYNSFSKYLTTQTLRKQKEGSYNISTYLYNEVGTKTFLI